MTTKLRSWTWRYFANGGWAVTADPTSAGEGNVTFEVTNPAGFIDIPHNFLAVKTNRPPDKLKRLPGMDAAGNKRGVDVSKVEVVDHVHMFFSGTTQTLSLDLEEGNYVLICNLDAIGVVDGTPPFTSFRSHYDEGMYTAFTVTDDDDQKGKRGRD